MTRAQTSRDVAQLAGVSQATVSYVLTGKRAITDATRRRVLDAVEMLGYRPHAGATALRARASHIIGLIFPIYPDGDRSGQSRFLAEIAGACRATGYDTLVVTADEGAEGMRRVAGTALCDGLLVADVRAREPLVPVAPSLPVPTVFAGLPSDRETVMCVDCDFEAAGRECAERIATAGHRRARLFLPESGRIVSMSYYGRFCSGFRERAVELGVEVVDAPGGHHDVETFWAARHLAADVRDAASDPLSRDAVVIVPSAPVGPVLSAFLVEGLRPGVDVSIVGTSASGPPETTEGLKLSGVDLRESSMAAQVVDRLVELIEGAPGSLSPGDSELIAPTTLPGNTVLTAS